MLLISNQFISIVFLWNTGKSCLISNLVHYAHVNSISDVCDVPLMKKATKKTPKKQRSLVVPPPVSYMLLTSEQWMTIIFIHMTLSLTLYNQWPFSQMWIRFRGPWFHISGSVVVQDFELRLSEISCEATVKV